MKNIFDLKKAAEILARSELVAIPTETVYGLAGNALSDAAVAKIYETKNRPTFNPLIVHVPSLTAAKTYVEFTEIAENLAAEFWPGPLTLILPRKKNSPLSLLVSAGLDTVAIRVPAHPMALRLLETLDFPLAAPSANKSGKISPTEAAHVWAEFGNALPVLDGGPCTVGLESTVLDLTEKTPVILRPGLITAEQLSQHIALGDAQPSAIKSPGMLEKHYAPNHPLRLNAMQVDSGEALLAFGKPLAGAAIMQNLSETGDFREAAANLFRMLRMLDASGAKKIAAMPIPNEGLGVAINDRLKRAATL